MSVRTSIRKGDLDLTVIDDLPEMIGWVKREERFSILRCE